MSINSPFPFLQGGIGDQRMQSLNFQNVGVSHWMQPRLDSSMHCLQPDIYQVMSTATLDNTNSIDHPVLHFQQRFPNIPTSVIQNQMPFVQNIPDSNIKSQPQVSQQQLHLRQQIESPSGAHFTPMSSRSQLQNFSDLIGTHMGSSTNSSMQNLLSSFSPDQVNLHGPNPLVAQSSSSKQVALDPQIPHEVSNFGIPHLEELGTAHSKVSDLSALLPPFPGREFSDFRGVNNLQHINLFFGVSSSDSSANMVNENESLSMPYAGPTYGSGGGTDFPLNSDMTRSSCADEHSSENVDQTIRTPGAFVMVHKCGSLGQSLDISKFRSYPELRSELARMFGLEGLLEDPQRSGWQLVFGDRENDILLLGDDPWQDFVYNVWYIKILSPMEVQQVGKEGLDLPNAGVTHQLSSSSNSCDDYMSRKDSRSNLNGMPSVGSLEF